MTEWLDNSNNANCFKSMYVSGFVDVSGIIISREPTLGLILNGDANFNAGLSVSGDTSFNNLQHARSNRVGGIKIGPNLAITDDGTLSISDVFLTTEDVSLNHNLYVEGLISNGTASLADGALSGISTLIVNDISLNAGLIVGSDVSINGNFYVRGDISWNSVNIPSDSIPASAIINGCSIPISRPTFSSDPGSPGQMKVDAGFLYICISLNNWQRVVIAGW